MDTVRPEGTNERRHIETHEGSIMTSQTIKCAITVREGGLHTKYFSFCYR